MKRRIGEILLESNYIKKDQLEVAILETKKTDNMVGEVLLRLDWITEDQLQMAMAVQSGQKILDISSVRLDISLVQNIPLNVIKEHRIIPFEKKDGIIKIATDNPFNVIATDKLSRETGCQIEGFVAPRDWVSTSIDFYCSTSDKVDEEIENINHTIMEAGTVEEDSIVKLANFLIEKGRMLKASDIHIVGDDNLVRILYRVDGVLISGYLFSKKIHQNIVSRFKIMADIDIANPNIPHDGRIQYSGPNGEMDIRVSTFPTQQGETVVMRLLFFSQVVKDIAALGIEKYDINRFMESIDRPYGLILTTGPTGSGKSTTLYASLLSINSPEINVMTIEDPIEYVVPGIRQTNVNPKAELTFATALRSAMRQDPDVMLVGEIRDEETANLALRASITGHLVLSTLHTNNAASTISRLIDLGVNSTLLASSLSMVIAQRLLRKVCVMCSTTKPITAEEKEIFIKNEIEPPSIVPEIIGCKNCNHIGYTGRIGVYEIIVVNAQIEKLIQAGALNSEIEEAAIKSGTTLLIKQSLNKLAMGITTMKEIKRVITNV